MEPQSFTGFGHLCVPSVTVVPLSLFSGLFCSMAGLASGWSWSFCSSHALVSEARGRAGSRRWWLAAQPWRPLRLHGQRHVESWRGALCRYILETTAGKHEKSKPVWEPKEIAVVYNGREELRLNKFPAGDGCYFYSFKL